jgi:hypothetical protein
MLWEYRFLDKKQLKEIIERLKQGRPFAKLYPGGYLPVEPRKESSPNCQE